MGESRKLPGTLRTLLEQALELAEELRSPQTQDEEALVVLLDDLKSRVADALSEVRTSSLPERQAIQRALKVADGILLHLTDPSQRDARGRLRDVATHLREAVG